LELDLDHDFAHRLPRLQVTLGIGDLTQAKSLVDERRERASALRERTIAWNIEDNIGELRTLGEVLLRRVDDVCGPESSEDRRTASLGKRWVGVSLHLNCPLNLLVALVNVESNTRGPRL